MKVYIIGAVVYDLVFDVPDWIQQQKAVHATHVALSPGGKGLNQAVAVSRLGADAIMIGCVGRDLFGDEILRIMEHEGVDCTHILRHESARTSIASIIVKDHIPGFIVAPDASKLIPESVIIAALSDLTASDVVLVNFEVPQSLVRLTLELGRRAGATTVLNPAPYFTEDRHIRSYLELADVIIPNRDEAALLAGSHSDSIEELSRALMRFGIKSVVVTNGYAGSIYMDEKITLKQYAFNVDVVDTTGASDAFVGGYCVGLAQGWDVEDMLKFGSAAAAVACQTHGTMSSMPTLKQVDKLIAKP